MANQVINVEEVQTLPRGRKKVIDSALLKDLSKVKPGQAVVLSETFGSVTEKNEQQTIAQKIRSHWSEAFGDESKCSIRWSPEGFAQVSHKAPKQEENTEEA